MSSDESIAVNISPLLLVSNRYIVHVNASKLSVSIEINRFLKGS